LRNLVALLLVGLISACPILCEAAEFGQGSHQCQADTSCDHPAENRSPCPDDGGSCICSGAIQAADVRIPDLDSAFLPDSIGLWLPPHSLRYPLFLHLTQDGGPTGLAGFGDAGAVRSLLQNFRC
jgi:hypothetical protein